MNTIEQIQEKKNKKKARRWSALLLLLLLLVLFIPFGDGRITTEPKFNNIIEVTFDDVKEFKEKASTAAAAKASKRKASAQVESPVEKPPAKAEPKPVEEAEIKPDPKPVAKPEPVKKMDPVAKITKAETKPILTDNSSSLKIEASDMVADVKESVKADKPAETKDESGGFLSGFSDLFSKAEGEGESTGAVNDGPEGDPSDGGEGDTGSSDSGDGNTDGDGEFGDAGDGDGFEGTGMLTRSIRTRGNVKSLIKENGKIVMNVCVDRDGNIVYAKAEDSASTVSTRSLRLFEPFMKKTYKYEKDYTAAEEECGRYKFSISGVE